MNNPVYLPKLLLSKFYCFTPFRLSVAICDLTSFFAYLSLIVFVAVATAGSIEYFFSLLSTLLSFLFSHVVLAAGLRRILCPIRDVFVAFFVNFSPVSFFRLSQVSFFLLQNLIIAFFPQTSFLNFSKNYQKTLLARLNVNHDSIPFL